MAKYLISFPSAAMNVSNSELEAASRDSHAVIRGTMEADVYPFGGLNEAVPPILAILVSASGLVTEGVYS